MWAYLKKKSTLKNRTHQICITFLNPLMFQILCSVLQVDFFLGKRAFLSNRDFAIVLTERALNFLIGVIYCPLKTARLQLKYLKYTN